MKIELTAGSRKIQIQWLMFESEQIINDEINGRIRGCFILCKIESKDTAEKDRTRSIIKADVRSIELKL